MYLPKKDVYKDLKKLGYPVYQTQPTVFNDLPAITFDVLDNNTVLCLDNTIAYQSITVKVDIWAEDSIKASDMLSEIEGILRLSQYNLEYSSDVPNPGDIFHITTKFKKVI